MTTEILKEYIIREHGGSQSKFAKANGVKRPQVTQWLNKEFIVVNGNLYSMRRELKNEHI